LITEPSGFPRWYYGVASAVALAAFGAGTLTDLNSAKDRDFLRIGMSVFGAGNGYLLGLMRGDLKRTLLATLVGAIAGYMAPLLLRLPAAPLGVWTIVVVSLCWAIFRNTISRAAGCAVLVAMIFVGYSLIIPAGISDLFPNPAEPKDFDNELSAMFESVIRTFLAAITSFPFMSSFFGVVMASDWKPRTLMQSVQNICNAAAMSQVAAGVLLFLGFKIARDLPVIGAIVAGIALIVLNCIFVRLVFSSLRRTEPLASSPVPPIPDSSNVTR